VVDLTINREALVPLSTLIIETERAIVANGKRSGELEPLQGACWFISLGHLAYIIYAGQNDVVPINVGVA
jgi:hypothetical protein